MTSIGLLTDRNEYSLEQLKLLNIHCL